MSDTAQAGYMEEVVPGKLYAVGRNLLLDGRSSWEPTSAAGRFQPLNTYLLRLDDKDVLIDPGIAYARTAVVEGLLKVVPADTPMHVLLTRAQFDCTGNLGEVASTFKIESIFTGGIVNPFDQFSEATATDHDGRARGLGVERSARDAPLELFTPALRLLASYWGYDPSTRTVFASDCFTHGTVSEESGRPVIDSHDDEVDVEQVRDHLFAYLWWLPFAERSLIRQHFKEFFENYPVDVIAPGRGCVITGARQVERHVNMVLDVLQQ